MCEKVPRLALAIPTYQRSEILLSNLRKMEEELLDHGVEVYVSDDSPDNLTEQALAPLTFVKYRRNEPSLRHDANLLATLTWPRAEFVWLLGDSHWILNGKLSEILRFLDREDFAFINSCAADRRIVPETFGPKAIELVQDKLWHQTLTGATIYSRRVCRWIENQGENLLVKKDFPQLSAMLGFASTHQETLRISWFGSPSLGSVPKTCYWHRDIVPVFVDHWSDLVEAFPSMVPRSLRTRTIRAHSANQNLFGFLTLLDLKLRGVYNLKRLRDPRFRRAMHLSLVTLTVALLMPKPFISIAKYIRRFLGFAKTSRRMKFDANMS